MKKYHICALLFLLSIFPLYLSAQTADRIEALLDTSAVSYGQATELILEAAGFAAMPAHEAFSFAEQQGWLPRNVSADAPVRLDSVSFLIMRAFDMRGGIFFTLFPGPHYAYRELVNRGILLGRIGPRMTVSGELLLFTVGRILSHVEAGVL